MRTELKLRNVRQHQQLNIFIIEKLWILLDGVILILLKLFGQYYCVILFYGLLYFSLASKAFHLLEKPCTSQEIFVKWIIWNESSVMSFAALNRHLTILSKTNSYISYCYFIYILYTFNDTNRCITWYSIFVQTRYQQDFHKKMLARCCNTNILQPWLRNISILLFINYD